MKKHCVLINSCLIFILISPVAYAERYSVEKIESGDYSTRKSEDDADPGRVVSAFEKAYLESEASEAAIALDGEKLDLEKTPYDATDVRDVDFVDGDDLVKGWSAPDEDKAPYYVTIDEYGRPTNTYYDQEAHQKALKAYSGNLEYTEANVHERPLPDDPGLLELPSGADPIAVAILGSGRSHEVSYFDAFSVNCCDNLPSMSAPVLEPGKYQYFVLSQEKLPFRFNEGDSRYILLNLPNDDDSNYPLKIKSFIREHKKKNIKHGVFFPQLITLDVDKKPLRIFTGPLLKYHEESWRSHGYLEGIFEIDRSNKLDERFILINTTSDAMNKTSTIESSVETITIEHMGIGTLEIEVLLGNGR